MIARLGALMSKSSRFVGVVLNSLTLENGSFLLQENGSTILLE